MSTKSLTFMVVGLFGDFFFPRLWMKDGYITRDKSSPAIFRRQERHIGLLERLDSVAMVQSTNYCRRAMMVGTAREITLLAFFQSALSFSMQIA